MEFSRCWRCLKVTKAKTLWENIPICSPKCFFVFINERRLPGERDLGVYWSPTHQEIRVLTGAPIGNEWAARLAENTRKNIEFRENKEQLDRWLETKEDTDNFIEGVHTFKGWN